MKDNDVHFTLNDRIKKKERLLKSEYIKYYFNRGTTYPPFKTTILIHMVKNYITNGKRGVL